MTRLRIPFLRLGLGLGLLMAGVLARPFCEAATATVTAEALRWRADKGTVDADLTGASLVTVLEQVAEATGWVVYLEPGTRRDISAKFKNRAPDKALDLLLGDLSRVLLPGTNGGPARLLVFRSSEKEATQVIQKVRKAKPIPNELIVTLKPGADLDALAKKLGAKVVARAKGKNAARLRFDDEAATDAARTALAGDDSVLSTDPNFTVAEQPLPGESDFGQGSPKVGVRSVKAGDPMLVGLIDTGVQKLSPEYESYIVSRQSVAGDATLSGERPSHGTSMAETILKGSALFSDGKTSLSMGIVVVDVYGNNGTTTTFEVAEGIYLAMEKGATVINLSLGSDGDTPYLRTVIEEGAKTGHFFVGSAGNTPVTSPTFPAAYDSVIAVTAGDAPGRLAPYANRGGFIDMMAPGSSIVSYNGNSWQVSGTSPAAALVSGAIVGKAEGAGLSLTEAVKSVQQTLPPPRVQ